MEQKKEMEAKHFTKRIELWFTNKTGQRESELFKTIQLAKEKARKLHKQKFEGVVIDVMFFDQYNELVEDYTKHWFAEHFLTPKMKQHGS